MSVDLNSTQTGLLTEAIAGLGGADFAARVLAFVRATVTFDSAVMMAYPEDAKLVVLHDELDAGDRAPQSASAKNLEGSTAPGS